MEGKDLRRLRERLGLSQEELAHLLGVSFATVNRWESSQAASSPRGTVLTVIAALAEGLKRDPELPVHLTVWSQRGQPYLLHRVFALAYGPVRRRSTR